MPSLTKVEKSRIRSRLANTSNAVKSILHRDRCRVHVVSFDSFLAVPDEPIAAVEAHDALHSPASIASAISLTSRSLWLVVTSIFEDRHDNTRALSPVDRTVQCCIVQLDEAAVKPPYIRRWQRLTSRGETDW